MTPTLLTMDEAEGSTLDTIYSSDLFLTKIKSPLYSRLSQVFYDEYNNHSWKNLSMALERDGKIIGIIVLWTDGHNNASYFNMPAQIALADTSTKEDIKLLFDYLQSEIKKLNITNLLVNTANFFSYHSIESVANETAYVDLDLPIEEIKRNVRKSYKSLINWGLKNLAIKVINDKNQDEAAFDTFMNFHRKVAGKVTRSDKSWALQYQMLCEGEAFLLMGYYEDELVSASLIINNESEAYYGVGVYNRDLMAQGLSLSHGMLFKAIELCKQAGVKRFILGEVGTVNSKKEENIAKFKSGFTKSFLTTEYLKLSFK